MKDSLVKIISIVVVILAILYIVGKTVEVTRETESENKSDGEITGAVAKETAKDIGDIFWEIYLRFRQNPINVTEGNKTNVNITPNENNTVIVKSLFENE